MVFIIFRAATSVKYRLLVSKHRPNEYAISKETNRKDALTFSSLYHNDPVVMIIFSSWITAVLRTSAVVDFLINYQTKSIVFMNNV